MTTLHHRLMSRHTSSQNSDMNPSRSVSCFMFLQTVLTFEVLTTRIYRVRTVGVCDVNLSVVEGWVVMLWIKSGRRSRHTNGPNTTRVPMSRSSDYDDCNNDGSRFPTMSLTRVREFSRTVEGVPRVQRWLRTLRDLPSRGCIHVGP